MRSKTPLFFFLKKLARMVIVLYIVITVNFIIPRLIPVNPIDSMLRRLAQLATLGTGGEVAAKQHVIEVYVKEFGFDKDIFTQYVNYLVQLLKGDLGLSIMYFPHRVQDIIFARLPWTLGLLLMAIVISWAIGNLLGALIAYRKGKVYSGICAAGIILNQIPYYFLALILVYVFAYSLHLFPPRGGRSAILWMDPVTLFFDILWHAFLPALSIVLGSIGGWMISMRSFILNLLGEDFMLFAEARGLPKAHITRRYALRNAILPQVTGLAMALGFAMSGSIIAEMIFSYPGIGTLVSEAAINLDYNVMQGCFLFLSVSVLVSMFIIEVLYPLFDPRVRIGGEK